MTVKLRIGGKQITKNILKKEKNLERILNLS